jgi:hypothetical protein
MSEVNSFQDLPYSYGVWQRSEVIWTLITPGMNRSWYHEPQLEKIDSRVNPRLESRRPYKIYKDGSENLNGHTTCVQSVLRW